MILRAYVSCAINIVSQATAWERIASDIVVATGMRFPEKICYYQAIEKPVPERRMNRRHLLIKTIAVLTLLVGSLKAQTPAAVLPTQWELDNSHSSVVFAVSHFGLSFVYGRFNECSGAINLDLSQPAKATFKFTVDADSIDTNDLNRDRHLRSKDFFDTTAFPAIKFESTKVEVKREALAEPSNQMLFLVTGNLTMHGQTKEIEIPLDLLAVGKGPRGDQRCGYLGKFVVKRSDFGIGAMPKAIGDSIAITFCFQAKEKKAEDESGADRDAGKESGEKQKTVDELFQEPAVNSDSEDSDLKLPAINSEDR